MISAKIDALGYHMLALALPTGRVSMMNPVINTFHRTSVNSHRFTTTDEYLLPYYRCGKPNHILFLALFLVFKGRVALRGGGGGDWSDGTSARDKRNI